MPTDTYADSDAPAVLLIGAPHDRAVLGAAVEAAGALVAGAIGWGDLAAQFDAPVMLAVAALGDAPAATLDDLLDPLAQLAEVAQGGVVVTMRAGQIDAVAAALLGAKAELLCDPAAATLAASVALALARCDTRLAAHLADRVRDGEAERLRRVYEEVARIVEVLARLTLDDPGRPGSVADRTNGYEGPPGAPNVSAGAVRAAIRARRLRDLQFPTGLFEDPAWDMLLDLYAAALEGTQVSVSSLCIAAAVPPTTALRWIGRMTESGLFERQPDPFDRRRAYMALSDDARGKMDRYFALLAQNGLTI